MRLMTNPGSNLSDDLVRRYGVTVLPQRITVDGVNHDTRQNISQETVDTWAATAKKWPTAIGTTAAETIQAFTDVVKEGEREIVVVTTSRKIINSHHGAEVAARTFLATPQGKDVRIAVVDSGVTDIGAAACCIVAGEAMRAGLAFDDVVAATTAAAAKQEMAVAVATLDNLVKGGRAGFLRAFVADIIGKRPVLGFADGELAVVDTWSRRGDMLERLAARLRSRVPKGRRVLLGIGHSADKSAAWRLQELLKDHFTIVAAYQRPIAVGVYLHAGPGALSAAVMPIDDLPWFPNNLEF